MSTIYQLSSKEKKFIGLHNFFAILALSIGSLFSSLQDLKH